MPRRRTHMLCALAAAGGLAGGLALLPVAASAASPPRPAGAAQTPAGRPSSCRFARSLGSRALGLPYRGRLVGGVALPEQTSYLFTWDFVTGTSPDPEWRRYGTDKLVRTLRCVLARYRARHPELARIGVSDLSRPQGGSFGRRYGGLGHASHQNGLDADLLYPRSDRCECPPDLPEEIDSQHAQELVAAFVRAGAQYVFVSPTLYRRGLLRGPRGVVIPLRFHDDHMHVRLPPDPPRPRRRASRT